MKSTKRRVVSLVLAIAMLVSIFGVLPVEAAETVPQFPYKNSTCYLMNPSLPHALLLRGVSKTSQVKNLKSSKKGVAAVSVQQYEDVIAIVLDVRKTGKTKISFTVKYGAGLKKSKKFSCTVSVKAYANPCKMFKLGAKNYASGFRKSIISEGKNPNKAQKLTIKANSGWKVTDVYGVNKKGKEKTLKNGKNVNTKSYVALLADFKNSKTGDTITLSYYLN